MASPFGMVVRKQLLESFGSARFMVAVLLCMTVGVGATVIRTQAYQSSLAIYRLNRIQHGAEAKSYKGPYRLTYSGVSLDKRPVLLGIFYGGLEPTRPMTVRITANRDPQTVDQHEQANPIAELFQAVDLMWFTMVVMSLLALVFSYDLVSGEKETGTLRLTFSHPMPRSQLLLGKWVGGYLSLGLPFILTALCSLGVVAFALGSEVGSGDLAGYALLMLSGLLYTGAFFSIGLFVSSRTHRSFTSITVLVAVWAGATLAVPHLSPYVARLLVRLPTIQEVERDKWAVARAEDERRGSRSREYRSATTDSEVQQGVVTSEFWRDSFLQIALRQEQIQSDYERRVDDQIQVASWLARVSPASSLIFASGQVTDTGVRQLRAFRRDLQGYRIQFLNYAEDKWIERVRQGGGEISTEDYPRFVRFRTGLGDRVAATLPDLALLGLWNVIFFAAAYVGFLRYDVR